MMTRAIILVTGVALLSGCGPEDEIPAATPDAGVADTEEAPGPGFGDDVTTTEFDLEYWQPIADASSAGGDCITRRFTDRHCDGTIDSCSINTTDSAGRLIRVETGARCGAPDDSPVCEEYSYPGGWRAVADCGGRELECVDATWSDDRSVVTAAVDQNGADDGTGCDGEFDHCRRATYDSEGRLIRDLTVYGIDDGVCDAEDFVGSPCSEEAIVRTAGSTTVTTHTCGDASASCEQLFELNERGYATRITLGACRGSGALVTTHEVDAFGRIVLTSNEGPDWESRTTYEYDGLVIRAEDERLLTEWELDGYGRIVEQRTYGDGELLGTETHTYDERGNVTSVTYPTRCQAYEYEGACWNQRQLEPPRLRRGP